MTGLSTARPLGASSAIAAGSAFHLRISAALPDTDELSVNGALPHRHHPGRHRRPDLHLPDVRAGTGWCLPNG